MSQKNVQDTRQEHDVAMANAPALSASPALPERDAEATARWTQAVLDGAELAPAALRAQAAILATACRDAAASARPLKLAP